MRLVAKFGGTSLGSGARIERAATAVADAVAAGHEVAVVASAMGSTTDDLLADITFEADAADRAEIVSMGERTAIRMFKAALESRDVAATYVEPGDEHWPILTDEYGELDVERTRSRATSLAADLESTVPVVAGFLAERPDGSITTLGRGGSDTTAMILGQYMPADEVVIVTDVEGVMTGDPRAVEGARNVGKISVDELRSLSVRGAEVVAPSALSYTEGDLSVRVVHYQHGDLITGGTAIEGQFEHLVDLRERPLARLTVAGRAIRNRPGILQELSTALTAADVIVDAVASGVDSLTFYVDRSAADTAERVLHEAVVDSEPLSSVTVDAPLAAIRITGADVPGEPGAISGMVDPLAEARIAVEDVVTSAASVSIFVDWEDRERALQVTRRVTGELF